MAAIVLALGVSLFLGTADFLGGQQTKERSPFVVLAVSQLVGLFALIPVVAIVHPAPFQWPYLGWSLLAAASVLLGASSLYRGLAIGKMSIVAPVSATAAIVPIAAGALAGERPSAAEDIGIAVALLGAIITSRPPDGGPRIARGVGFAILSALGGGFFLVAMDAASEGGIIAATVSTRVSLMLMLALVGLAWVPEIWNAKPNPWLVALGILEVSAWVMFAAASTLGLLAVVGLLASLYPVVTVLLARYVLREAIGRGQLSGIALVILGLGLIATG